MSAKVSISGYGAVGKALHDLFPEAEIYDPPLGYKNKNKVNDSYFHFISVPTPALKNGTCDTSIIQEILSWSKAEINIIRSTPWVGFTDWAVQRYGKKIIFMPEYGPSDFPNHPFNHLKDVHWAVLGGDIETSKEVAELWKRALYKCKIYYTNAKTAELVKLAENAYLYQKVIFFNQIYNLCQKLGINYDELQLLLTEDPRIEDDHSNIFPTDRKIGGKCLPKDMKNLITLFEQYGLDPKLFKTLEDINEGFSAY